MKKRFISTEEIEWESLSVVDDVGRVFYYQGKVFRAIFPGKEKEILVMFESGMIQEVMNLKLIPNTYITEYVLDGYTLVLEHEKISNVSYIVEWSFDMIRDAALLILKLSEVLLNYGYVLKDCHPYNILFKENHPYYIDIGSFKKNHRLLEMEEFLSYYYQILQIMEENTEIARSMLRANHAMKIKNNLFLILGIKNKYLIDIFMYLYKFKKTFYIKLKEKIFDNKRVNKFLIEKYKKLLLKMKSPQSSKWGWYQDISLDSEGNIILDKKRFSRFYKVLKIIDSLKIKTVLEIGGNAGAFSILLAENTDAEDIVCTDYDECSVNKLYNIIKKESRNIKYLSKISPLVFDILSIHRPVLNQTVFDKRFHKELVIAMAITHHLLLVQHVNIQCLFERFASLSGKYLIVEFMPLGLWGGNSNEIPEIPKWYNVQWFKKNMKKFFNILYEEELEINRIVFLGEKV